MKFRFVNFLLNEYYIGFHSIMKNRKFYNLYIIDSFLKNIVLWNGSTEVPDCLFVFRL